ncbi:MAG: response regulator [Candidatus Woesearchaeota archaeon]
MEKVLRILIADDNFEEGKRTLAAISKAAVEEGAEVILDYVKDGGEAWIEANRNGYNGIFLDFQMPIHSGLEVIRDLREAGDRTPAYLVTNFHRDTYALMLEVGGNGLIDKRSSEFEQKVIDAFKSLLAAQPRSI